MTSPIETNNVVERLLRTELDQFDDQDDRGDALKVLVNPDGLEAADLIQSLSDRIDVPIPMLLYCPQCGQHHVDEPDERTPDWTNPPHRSHLCHDCGCIWRPTDVPTTGVRAIQTQGKADTWTAERGNAETASLTQGGNTNG